MTTDSPGMKQQATDTENDPAQVEQTSLDEAIERLSADPTNGLAEDEAKRRLEKYGPNMMAEEEHGRLLRLLSHFWGPIPWMIEIAAILALVAGRWEEFTVIFVMLLINGGVGFWHESKADRAIQALKDRLAPEAIVIRDGRRKRVDARQLVPGDIVVLKMGNIVPADADLLAGQHLSLDESALTGESLPVDKAEADSAYSGTTIKRGEAKALVTATGARTKFARTVELVEEAEQASHFQKAVLRIGYFLIGITLFLDVVILGVSILLRQDPWLEVVLLVLALTLAGIPQALPAVLSVTMSIGAHRLARMKAIVSRLPAMEEMAGLEVLCADKTGTLTENRLTLHDAVVLEAEDEHDLLLASALTCPREDNDDPIDVAVLSGFTERFDGAELDEYEVVDFKPFDPTSKRAEATIRSNGRTFQAAKGAPQVILDLADPNEDEREDIKEQVDDLGKRGFRALGVARSENSGSWRFLGLLPLLDPPREDCAQVLADAADHGIDVRMITGDHAAIARQVAGQVGLGEHIVKATDLFGEAEQATEGKEKRGKAQIRREVLSADGFAEVTPEHKFRLIQAFQANDRIVGMTGDGVNDAPALQQADVGIAVAGATDAARAASALVLTEQGLGVITHAVEEARRIFERMTSYATFRITETMRMLLFIGVAILALNYYPVTPIMIVLLAILNDIPIMAIAWDNARTARHPVRWDMSRVLTLASVMSVTGVASSFLLFGYFRFYRGFPLPEVQTIMFLKLLVAGHMTLFLARSRGWLWERPWPNVWMFLALEGTQIAGTLVAVYGILVTPIGWLNALIVWGYAIVWILVLDGVKVLTHRILDTIRGEAPPKGRREPIAAMESVKQRLDDVEHTIQENRELLQESLEVLHSLAGRGKR